MALTIDQLKQIAREYIQKDAPDLASEEPSHQEEERIIASATQAKLSLPKARAVPTRVNVFTFKKTVTAEDGAKIPLVSRITVDADGNIIKATGN